jgi:methyl-accepting chemotaxis protein
VIIKPWHEQFKQWQKLLKENEKMGSADVSRSFKFKLVALSALSVALFSLFSFGCLTYILKSINGTVVSDPARIAFIQTVLICGLIFISLTVCGLAYLVSLSISNTFGKLARRLLIGTDNLTLALKAVASSSVTLSDASTQQASAIQETAASVDEVSAMARKSADNASASQKVSENSRLAAEEGHAAIQEMIQAIEDISKNNTAIMTQVENGNRQISEIVKVIGEIETKTKVINDIVFQTKLLSFNASVEAARAGEHGKGFAVVAEEVGKLAQMSGNAAKEISLMLAASILKVEGIVNETKSKVEHLVIEGKSRVDGGTRIAHKCGEALAVIITTVMEVDGMIAEISSASGEQAQGVSEINKAMNQLDQTVQKNSVVALETSKSSEQLSAHANGIKQTIQELYQMIGNHSVATPVIDTPQMTVKSFPVNFKKTEPKKPLAKVLKLKINKPVQVAKTKATDVHRLPEKKVSGQAPPESNRVPSKDDPRFEDV